MFKVLSLSQVAFDIGEVDFGQIERIYFEPKFEFCVTRNWNNGGRGGFYSKHDVLARWDGDGQLGKRGGVMKIKLSADGWATGYGLRATATAVGDGES